MNMNRIATCSMLMVCLLLTCTGCSTPSLSQIKQFGSASSSLGEQARKAFDLAATASVDRKIYDVAADSTKGPTDDTFQGIFSGDKAESLALRLRVLDALANYSGALQKLAEADLATGIDTASKDLNGSLIALRATYQKASGKSLPLTDADIGIISTAIDAIGKAVVEAKRRSAIKTIIITSDGAVQKAAELITSDLGSNSDLASFVKETVSNSRGSVQQAYNSERGKSSSTFESRYTMLLRARQLYDTEMGTPAFFTSVSKGADSAAKAHNALLTAVKDNKFSSQEVAVFIGDLQNYVKSVEAFYNSLQPKK
jgi:hypothetical protein